MTRPHFPGIPEALRGIPHWITWRNDVSDQVGYPRGKKVPKHVNGRLYGSSTDYNTWGGFKGLDLILDAYPSLSGVGFCLTQNLGITCIDLDHCVRDDTLDPWAQEIVDMFTNKTYIEASFHKDGLHIWAGASLPYGLKGGKMQSSDGTMEIEAYDSGRYIAVTGWHLKGSLPDIGGCQPELDALLKRFPKAEAVTDVKPPSALGPRPSTTTITDALELSCRDIGMPEKAVRTATGYQGAHPFHGSTTGSNYCIDTSKDVWHCFRHNTGGGALELFAIREGIISCEYSGPGCLDGKWPEVFEALRRCGYDLQKAGIEDPIWAKRREVDTMLRELGVRR
jgi:primase-polymerase (primpol)-like protein